MSLREFASRIRGLFSQSRLDRELNEELNAHLEMLVEDAPDTLTETQAAS